MEMTTEEIKRMVDDERAELLTAQVCRHWEVATQRLDGLAQELTDHVDTCIEAEIYAALMRMQRAVMALMELNKIPSAYLFSEYLDRVAKSVSNSSIRQSAMTLVERLLGEQPASSSGESTEGTSFFDLLLQSLASNVALPSEQQAVPLQHVFAACAQHLNPSDLMVVATIIQNMNTEGDTKNQEETTQQLMQMRQAMDTLATQMSGSLQMMLIWLMMLMLLPGLLVSLMQQSRNNSKAMAQLFSKVLVRVRESKSWGDYWKDRRETLRVVSDDSSWRDIMTAERTKERTVLGQVAGGLFAKWTTDREAFDEVFLAARLSDDDLRHFIFHLTALYEIARELDPTTKYGDEQLVNNELQRVGEAVLAAAQRLHDLVDKAWLPHYDKMWKELIENETIFAHLIVTRKSPHNNLFTARFFCHLVGEMKKRAVFGAHSDGDLAKKLTETKYVSTFRKNIQEGMGEENKKLQTAFNTIYQKYKALAHPKK